MGEVVAQLAELAVEYKTELERLKVVVADHKAASEDHYTAGYKAAQSLNLQREEAAYDKGYDDGWWARDDMAGRNLKIAEDLAFDNGWVAGVKATLDRKPHLPLAE